MAEFVQSPDQQDPDALKKALLAKLFGGPIPGAVPQPDAYNPKTSPSTATPIASAPPATTQPNASATPSATPISAAGPQPAKPLAIAAPIQPGEAQPLPPKDVYDQQHPLPAHTPYVAPDFKHRLLEGIYAGMQEFGRPGEGAATVSKYLGDIQKHQEEEKNYPATAAAQLQDNYLAAGKAAEVPAHLRELHAQIKKTEADAKAKLDPPQKLQHINIDDPQNPGHPKIANFDQHTGAFLDPDTGLAIPGAKPWEKPERTQPAKMEYDSGIPVAVSANGKTYDIHDPNLPPELKPLVDSATKAHKQRLDEEASRLAGAEDRKGTWTLAEDKDGKPIMYNSKSGETRPADGIQKTRH